MSKNSNLPDFQKLCEPARLSISYLIGLEIFYFFLAAMGGFFWEVLIFLVKEHRFYNRGFLYGPWLPVYGVGAVLLSLCIQCTNFCARRSNTITCWKKKSVPKVFFFSLLLGSVVELFVGWLLETFWQLRYWDYSDYFCNYNGYVCLVSALGFGVAGVVWICLLAPLLEKIYQKMPAPAQCILNTLLVLAFLFDCAASLIFPNTGRGITF